MILDHLAYADLYRPLARRMHHAFAFLRRPDLDTLAVGKHPVVGDDVFALVQEYQTKGSPEEGRWEAHRNYLDVQYMAAGAERMGYACIDSVRTVTDYDPARDVQFFEGIGSDLIVMPGMFAIFAPNDVHRPCLAVEQPVPVRKVVMKVRVDV